MNSRLANTLKKIFRAMGLHVERLSRLNEMTLLGLGQLPITTILDAGANEGQFARYISRFFPRARIHCYEPLPDAFEKLSHWAREQNGRVTCVNAALGDAQGTVTIFKHTDHYYSSSLLVSTDEHTKICELSERQERQSVEVTTLDAQWQGRMDELGSGVLIKLDVQGFEDRVIRGGSQVFSVAAACIVEVGIGELYQNQASFMSVAERLRSHGLFYAGNLKQAQASDGRVVSVDSVFWRPTQMNYPFDDLQPAM